MGSDSHRETGTTSVRKIGLIGQLILIIGSPCNITFNALIMRSGRLIRSKMINRVLNRVQND